MLTYKNKPIEPKVGSSVNLDGYPISCELLKGDDDSSFRIKMSKSSNLSFAAKIKITGRTVQRDYVGPRVRIRILFSGDGIPCEECGGWMRI